jgi:hypothetical protein
MRHVNYYVVVHHETASKFVGQRRFWIKYSAGEGRGGFPTMIEFPKPVRSAPSRACLPRKPMKKLVFKILLIASPVITSPVIVSPVLAQTKLVPKSVVPKSATARVDNCAPIGRTEDGKLVYSMKCETLPTPPPPPPQAEVAPAPPPEPEVQRSGIFGWSYERKRPDQ